MRERRVLRGCAVGVVLLQAACFDPEDPNSSATAGSTDASGPSSSSDTPTTAVDTTAITDSATSTTADPGTTDVGDTTQGSSGSSSDSSSEGDSSSTGVTESCDDGLVNQDESDVDCGGSICSPCLDGQSCGAATDCVSLSCGAGVCENYCAQGCPLAGSTNAGTVHVYDPVTLDEVASFVGAANVQSVAGASGGLIYAGGSSQDFEIDIAAGTVTPRGGGILSGPMYGIVAGAGGETYHSGSGMPDVRILEPDGSDGGIVDVLVGTNLRSTAFGPDGSFYVVSFGGGLVERWNPGFIYAGTFNGGGLSTPFGVATRSDGTVLVSSQNNATFSVYTAGGAFVSSVAVACTGQLRNLAVDAADRLFVGCYGSNRVAVFSLANVEVDSIPLPTPSGVGMLYEWPGSPP